MKVESLVEAVERFFLDFIGLVIPGTAMIVALWLLIGQPSFLGLEPLFLPVDASAWIVLIVAGYVAGHAVTSIGRILVLQLAVEPLVRLLRKKHWTARLVPTVVRPQDELLDRIASSVSFRRMLAMVREVYNWPEIEQDKASDVHDWRNVALSMIQEESQIVYRFMFISLLCLGIATVLILTGTFWLIFGLLRICGLSALVIPLDPGLLAVLFLTSLPFLERRYRFYDISMRIPFAMAMIKLGKSRPIGSRPTSGDPPSLSEESSKDTGTDKLQVYLAGGFHSGWQDRVMSSCPTMAFLDPRTHNLAHSSEYATWDLEAIRQADLIFAYLEASNPGGYDLALEIGFAKALGKTVILVDEKSEKDEITAKYFTLAREISDVTFRSLGEGLEYLKAFTMMRKMSGRKDS